MKKFLPYLTALVLVVLALSALVVVLLFAQSGKKEPVVLHYAGLWDPDVFNPLKEKFQRSHPNIIVEYEQKDESRYFPYLTKALVTKSAPDLFWWHSSWAPVLNKSLAPVPSTIYSSSEFGEDFYPFVKESLKINSSYRGIPIEIDGLALLYNKDLFAAKGFLNPPTDFISLKNNYAPTLTIRDAAGQVQTGGAALGSVSNVENFSEIVGLFMLQNKVKFIEKGNLALSQTRSLDGRNLAADALSVYNSFLTQDRVWSDALPSSTQAFANSKAAMIYLPAHRLPELLEYLKAHNTTLNFGVSEVPQLVSSDPVTWGGSWINGVSASSKNQQAAWELAKFLSEKDSLRSLFQAETKLNGVGSISPRLDMASELVDNPLLGPYVKQAPFAKSWYLFSDTGDDELNGKIVSSFANQLSQPSPDPDRFRTIEAIEKDIQPTLQSFGLVAPLAKKQ